MPTGRNHLAAVALRGSVWALGGRVGGANLSVVERYRPRRDAWSTGAALDVPRSGHAAAVGGGRVFAFGGEELSPGGTTIADVESMRPGGSWSTDGLPPMRTARHGLGGASYRGKIYALEGGPQPGYSFSSTLESLRVP
jgi:hypothetical protein